MASAGSLFYDLIPRLDANALATAAREGAVSAGQQMGTTLGAEAGKAAGPALSSSSRSMEQAASDMGTRVGTAIGRPIGNALLPVGNAISWAQDQFHRLPPTVQSVMTEIPTHVANAGRSMVSLFESSATQAVGTFTRMGSGIVDTLKETGAQLGITGKTAVGAIAAMALASGLEFDSMRQHAITAFTTLTGSAATAQTTFEDLSKFAATTPFALPGIVDASQKILGMGFSTEQVVPLLQGLGDATVSMGGDMGTVSGLVTQLGVAMDKGTLSSRQLLTLARSGVPVFQILANAYGVSTVELQKMMNKGLIPAADAIPKLMKGIEDGSDGVAGHTRAMAGAMVAQSQTISGSWTRFRDMFDETMGNLIQPVIPLITNGMNILINVFAQLPKALDFLGKIFAPMIDGARLLWAIVGPLLVPVFQLLGGVLVWVGGLLLAFTGYLERNRAIMVVLGAFVSGYVGALIALNVVSVAARVATLAWTAAQWLLNVALTANPIGIIIGVLAALVVGLIYAYNNSQTFRDIVNGAWTSIRTTIATVWAFIQGVFTGIVTVATTVAATWNTTWASLGAIWTALWTGVRNTVVGAWTAITGYLSGQWSAISALASTIWNAITDYFTRLFNAHRALIMGVWAAITGFLSAQWSGIQNEAILIWTAISAFFTMIWNAIRNTVVTIWNAIAAFFSGAWAIFSAANALLWSTISGFIAMIWNAIRTTVVNAWNGLMGFLSPAFAALQALWTSVWNGISTFFTGIWNGILSTVQSIWNNIVSTIRGAVNLAINAINGITGGINVVLTFLLIPNIPSIPGLAAGGSVGAGFTTNGPVAIVGEGNPLYPEFVIPTDPAHRDSARSLYTALGQQLMAEGGLLGVPRLASGGVLGDITSWITGGADALIAAGRDIATGILGPAANGPIGKMVLAVVPRIVDGATGMIKKAWEAMQAAIAAAAAAIFGGSANVIGGSPGGGAAQWASVILQVLGMLGQPASLLAGVERRINFESGGNPQAINLTDSNAVAGHPSQGLMQTIPSTFAAYAGPYAGRGITDPLANIYAGLAYAISRYGSVAAIDPLNMPSGYDSGGVLMPGTTLAYNGTGRPELVLTAEQAAAASASSGSLIGSLSIQVPSGATARDVVDELSFALRHTRQVGLHARRSG